jgi:ubiquinone/menaquinone biosynthesis C-methylase UbiE
VSDRERLARAFDAIVDRYERGRSEYPDTIVDAIVERLALGPGRRVLDLAAGTGKLTRRLVATGADVVAVEPGESLVAFLRETLPDVDVRAGQAESIPLEDASVDAVTVAAAFHWFRTRDALREIHRVLRPDGSLALVWNPIVWDDDLRRATADLIEPLWGKARPHGGRRDWRPVVTRSGLFGEPEEIAFEDRRTLDADGVVDRMLSVSAVAAAPEETQRELERELRRVVADRGGTIEARMRPFALVARRL